MEKLKFCRLLDAPTIWGIYRTKKRRVSDKMDRFQKQVIIGLLSVKGNAMTHREKMDSEYCFDSTFFYGKRVVTLIIKKSDELLKTLMPDTVKITIKEADRVLSDMNNNNARYFSSEDTEGIKKDAFYGLPDDFKHEIANINNSITHIVSQYSQTIEKFGLEKEMEQLVSYADKYADFLKAKKIIHI